MILFKTLISPSEAVESTGMASDIPPGNSFVNRRNRSHNIPHKYKKHWRVGGGKALHVGCRGEESVVNLEVNSSRSVNNCVIWPISCII